MTITQTIQEPTRNESVTVSTASKVIADARNQLNVRKNIVVRNISPNALDIITINIGFGEAVANKGIILKQNESYTDSNETGYESYQGVITAICATINGVVSIYER